MYATVLIHMHYITILVSCFLLHTTFDALTLNFFSYISYTLLYMHTDTAQPMEYAGLMENCLDSWKAIQGKLERFETVEAHEFSLFYI